MRPHGNCPHSLAKVLGRLKTKGTLSQIREWQLQSHPATPELKLGGAAPAE